jgi:hypothetical protein
MLKTISQELSIFYKYSLDFYTFKMNLFFQMKKCMSSNLPSTRKVLLTFFRYINTQLGKYFLADKFFRVCFSARALRARKIYKAQQLFLTSTAS